MSTTADSLPISKLMQQWDELDRLKNEVADRGCSVKQLSDVVEKVGIDPELVFFHLQRTGLIR
jgi:hypothetical protein